MLIVKARKTIGYFSNSSAECVNLNKNPGKLKNLNSTLTMQKVLLLVQHVETRWNSTYLRLKRLEKLKTSVQNYVVINSTPILLLQLTNGNWLATLMYCLKLFALKHSSV